MADTRKLLVAFDPLVPHGSSSDFVIPVHIHGKTQLHGIKSRSVHSFGMMVFVGRTVTESDLITKVIDSGIEIDNVVNTTSQLKDYIEKLQSFRIGNILRLREVNERGVELELVASSPSGFAKQFQSSERRTLQQNGSA